MRRFTVVPKAVFTLCTLAWALLGVASAHGQDGQDGGAGAEDGPESQPASESDAPAGEGEGAAPAVEGPVAPVEPVEPDQPELAGGGGAPTPEPPAPSPFIPLYERDTLSVAGGVSLGSFGAGYAYYLTLKRHEAKAGSFKAVTGTSAGAMNSVMAALSACKTPQKIPEESIFFKAWIPVGLRLHSSDGAGADASALNETEDVTAISLLSRQPMVDAAKLLNEYYEAPGYVVDPDTGKVECSVDLGLVATRLTPRAIALQGSDGDGVPDATRTPHRVQRQTEKFVVRLEYQDAGPVLRTGPHIGDLSADDKRMFLLLRPEPGAVIRFADLTDVLKASASFPLAFAPMPLHAYEYDSPNGVWKGSDVAFVDGAVFENLPVGLAHQISDWQGEARRPALVIDTEAEAWVRRNNDEPARIPDSLMDFAASLGGSVLASTMHAELLDAFRDAEIRRNTAFAEKLLPAASGHLANFGGFLARDFRVFDFYLGMLSASTQMGEPPSLSSQEAQHWQRFQCFRQWRTASNDFTKWPAADDIPACASISNLEWTSNHCWAEPDADECPVDRLEEHGETGANLVRLLAASQAYRKWTVVDNDSERALDEWESLLGSHGVALGWTGDLRQTLRSAVAPLLFQLARKQNKLGDRAVLMTVGPLLANVIRYGEPRHILSVGVHTARGAQVGWGARLKTDFLRHELDVRLAHLNLKDENEHQWALRSRWAVPLGTAIARTKVGTLLQVEPFTALGFSLGRLQEPNQQKWSMKQAVLVDVGLHIVLLQRLYVTGGWSPQLWVNKPFRTGRRDRLRQAQGSLGWRFQWW